MKTMFARMMLVAGAGILPAVGCQTCQRPCAYPPPPPPVYGGAFVVPPVDRSVPSGPVVPPGPPNPLTQTVAPDARNFAPPAAVPSQPTWGPATNGNARLLAPEIATPEPPISTAKPVTPGTKQPETKSAESKPSPEPKPGPTTPALPVDIPAYAPVKDGIASGQTPFEDGFRWLKENEYRAVLFIREPGEEDSADKRRAEAAGLKYLNMEFSAKKVGQPAVDAFNAIIAEAANRPLFVYDRNGTRAGALWYLHFRIADRMSDEDARTKAAAHGLKTDKDSFNQPLWLAIQKYLSTQTP
jgi:uncharacterized protein (TIGR01244 family)